MTRLTNATSAITGFLFSVVLMTSCSTAKDEKTASAEETAQTIAETKVNDKAITPSFDCAKAKTEVEKLICSDPELARLDREMANSYVAFMETLDEDFYRKKLVRKQHDWLGYRGKLSCFNSNKLKKTECLKNAYKRRIQNLSDWTKRNNYDFWADFFDYSAPENAYLAKTANNGYWEKVISELGEEYFVYCEGGNIYPSVPDEKFAFYQSWEYGFFAFPRLTKEQLGLRFRYKKEDDTLYLICSRDPIKNYKKYYENVKKRDGSKPNLTIQEFPLDVDNVNLKQNFKEKLFSNNVTAILLKDLDAGHLTESKMCSEEIEYIKRNFDKLKYINVISAKSIKELLTKTKLSCSEKQMRILFDEFGRARYPVSTFPQPVFGQYIYVKENDGKIMLGGNIEARVSSSLMIARFDEKKCDWLPGKPEFIHPHYATFYIESKKYTITPSATARNSTVIFTDAETGCVIMPNK